MAEYIDKKCLDRKFQIDMMCLRGGTIFDTQKIIDSLPTADVIEREKIDKAIEEMELHAKDCFENDYGGLDEYKSGIGAGLSDAIDILKRNIGEE